MSRGTDRFAKNAEARRINMVRRVDVLNTGALEWVLGGYTDDEGRRENIPAENFGNVGFTSRPPDTANAEAVIVNLGGYSEHPLAIASRDAETEKAFEAAESLRADESAVYNSKATMHILADGRVVARSLGGSTKPLAFTSAVKGIIDAIKAGVPATGAPDSGAALQASIVTALNLILDLGTSVLEAE